MKFYRSSIAYKQRLTFTLVSSHYKEDPKVGIWAKHQRQLFNKNKLLLLLDERYSLLGSIDFVWEIYQQDNNIMRIGRW